MFTLKELIKEYAFVAFVAFLLSALITPLIRNFVDNEISSISPLNPGKSTLRLFQDWEELLFISLSSSHFLCSSSPQDRLLLSLLRISTSLSTCFLLGR